MNAQTLLALHALSGLVPSAISLSLKVTTDDEARIVAQSLDIIPDGAPVEVNIKCTDADAIALVMGAMSDDYRTTNEPFPFYDSYVATKKKGSVSVLITAPKA